MSKIISICNQKGGTGKTTTTINLSAALAEIDKKVLIVDVDPQGNATSGIGVNKNELEISIYDVLLQRVNVEDAIIKNVHSNLDIIPCNINLTAPEKTFKYTEGVQNRLTNKSRML